MFGQLSQLFSRANLIKGLLFTSYDIGQFKALAVTMGARQDITK
jgi:dTDP-4-dehydrorhamnose 3,5-epimerase-like enzyme